jgi:rod shape-determining protein MreD
MAQISITSREQIQVYRFSLMASFGLPLLALFVQSLFVGRLGALTIFDLPLLVTIFFAVARRSPVMGVATGAIIGLFQDALTHNYIGFYGVAKTVVGYLASSLGVKLDVDNPGARLLMTSSFYLVHRLVYILIARGMAGSRIEFSILHELLAAVANGLLGVVVFAFLDRFKQRS